MPDRTADPAFRAVGELADVSRSAPVALRADTRAFFDEQPCTVSYVVRDPQGSACTIVDSIPAFDSASGRTSTCSIDEMVNYIKNESLTVQWPLETHARADHLCAAPWLHEQPGGQLAIGREIVRVQQVFGKVFNARATASTRCKAPRRIVSTLFLSSTCRDPGRRSLNSAPGICHMDIRSPDPKLSVSPQRWPGDMAAVAAVGFRSVMCSRPDGESPDQPAASVVGTAARSAGLQFETLPVVAGSIADTDVARSMAGMDK